MHSTINTLNNFLAATANKCDHCLNIFIEKCTMILITLPTVGEMGGGVAFTGNV